MDFLKLFEDLKAAELLEPQARAIAHAIGSAFQHDNLHQDKNLARTEDIARVDADMNQIAASLRLDMARLETRIIRWMFIFWVGQLAAVFTAFKMLK